MKREPERDHELLDLLSAMLDGRIAPAQQQRLGDLLRDSSEAQQAYLDSCWAHALLQRELGDVEEPLCARAGVGETGEPSASGGPQACRDRTEGSDFPASAATRIPDLYSFGLHLSTVSLFRTVSSSFLCSYIIVALAIGAAVFGAWAWTPRDHRESAHASGSQSGPGAEKSLQPDAAAAQKGRSALVIGKITRAEHCRWGNPYYSGKEGQAVVLGSRFDLVSGVLEIAYDAGARVALRGPSAYEANAVNGGFLWTGTFTVNTKQTFTLGTPDITFADQDGEVRIAIFKAGKGRVTRVFSEGGKILASRNDSATEGSVVRFDAGKNGGEPTFSWEITDETKGQAGPPARERRPPARERRPESGWQGPQENGQDRSPAS